MNSNTGTTTVQLSSERIATGLNRPLFLGSPPGDRDRLFVLEQTSGSIKIMSTKTGKIQSPPFLTIPAGELLKGGFEQGLLGLAFHPNYRQNGKFYVSYTAPGGGAAGQTKVVEYRVSTNNPNLANPGSSRTVLTINQPQENHNGGWLAFGKDGYLYWASGDGGGSGFQPGIPSESDNALDLTDNLLGKILRLDVNGDDFASDPNRNYAIPDSNPFVNKAGDDEIWSYGLRNPWRPSFDRKTGDLYIADVGQGRREEINVQSGTSRGGENYGWNRWEGSLPFRPGADLVNPVFPIYEYEHGDNTGKSITGGYVYRGPVKALRGTYIFGDFVSGNVWSFRYANNRVQDFKQRTTELTSPLGGGQISDIASFGEDQAGNLYVVGLDGEIFRLNPNLRVLGDSTDNKLRGDLGQDILNGITGDDHLAGLRGNDQLLGSAGNDTLKGGDGDDSLTGASGNDQLVGGTGRDQLIFSSNRAFRTADFGRDGIVDFEQRRDRIVLDKTAFGSLRSTAGTGFSVATEFAVVTTTSGAELSQGRIVYVSSTGQLFYNENGRAAGLGEGGQFATLVGELQLAAADFTLT